ncbi:hypothetical protein B0T18DRAFT_424646 [Schizothecium vesticola]|uniref:NEDD8-activating enzyme E1 catalytic subunit n=1 Tax=Schizothecium vesticola TaxID=314040 RepID=A0AA40FAG4_9PEZI|nr:hypothetical protein B0T18DRAFT_424646 [Schizothecium vesticola]
MASAQAYPSSEPERWKYLDRIRTRAGPFTNDGIFDGSMVAGQMDKMKILVIGAGGLGCEILKNLALSGFKDIHVIDMDTIDISNLNRQFLFRQADVGSSKAEVAARFVEQRVRGVRITPHNCRIQDKDEDFYMGFQLVVCGLDSIEARRWINATLVNMVDDAVEDSYTPLIDGGTEGFKGQARVVIPTITSCLECQLDMHAPRAAVPLCTLATIPRQPEHCVEWAHVIAWDQEKPFPELDKDDPAHIGWLYQKALARAHEFRISGVTYALTQGVVKNIIPAIAATNSVIAAACCNEALKISSSCAPALGYPDDNYMMYSGNDAIYTYTFKHEQKDDCPVCGNLARELDVDPAWTLGELVESLAARPAAQLRKPSVRAAGKTLYMQSPASLEAQTRPNLERTLSDLGLREGDEIGVTDPAFATVSFKFKLKFTKKS